MSCSSARRRSAFSCAFRSIVVMATSCGFLDHPSGVLADPPMLFLRPGKMAAGGDLVARVPAELGLGRDLATTVLRFLHRLEVFLLLRREVDQVEDLVDEQLGAVEVLRVLRPPNDPAA